MGLAKKGLILSAQKLLWSKFWLVGLCLFPCPVKAESPVSFVDYFQKAITDQALDRKEYILLKSISLNQLRPEEIYLAKNLLTLLAKYQSLVHLSFRYVYQHRQLKASFLFSPTFSEDDLITDLTPHETLGRISQQDLLVETHHDTYRCGSAALLAAHYLLFGSFERVLQHFQLSSGYLNYRHLHWLQEKLYLLANKDGVEGLSQQLLYQIQNDGSIKITSHQGEILDAANEIELSISPILSTSQSGMIDREIQIRKLWEEQPKVPLLVGVYLDPDSGQVRSPNETDQIQNHFVLVFKENNLIWMYNSGVIDNGLQTAVHLLNAQEIHQLILETSGAVNAVYRQPKNNL